MKKRLCAGGLSLLLLLSGCSGMLERSYTSVQSHTQHVGSQSGAALEAQNYQQLVSAVLYLVTQHTEEGVIRLYNYTGDVESDLGRACLEVAEKDPLGAFAVEEIRHDISRIVSFYEAQVDIAYLRTAEEMSQIVSVTGSGAIKQVLREAFSQLDTKALLRLSYYAEGEDYLTSLIRQAYYDTPLSAFGIPEITISLYPESGIQRIAEIDLHYPVEPETLSIRQEELAQAAAHLLSTSTEPDAKGLYELLLDHVSLSAGNTAYDALVSGTADAEGLALAYKLLCDEVGLTCNVVQGEGAHSFWNIVTTASGSRHVDCANALFGLTDHQLEQVGGYEWGGSYPICRDGSELELIFS